jgi:hypothetical protein
MGAKPHAMHHPDGLLPARTHAVAPLPSSHGYPGRQLAAASPGLVRLVRQPRGAAAVERGLAVLRSFQDHQRRRRPRSGEPAVPAMTSLLNHRRCRRRHHQRHQGRRRLSYPLVPSRQPFPPLPALGLWLWLCLGLYFYFCLYLSWYPSPLPLHLLLSLSRALVPSRRRLPPLPSFSWRPRRLALYLRPLSPPPLPSSWLLLQQQLLLQSTAWHPRTSWNRQSCVYAHTV